MKKVLFTVAVLLLSLTAFARPTGLNVGGGALFNFVNSSSSISTEKGTLVGPFAEVGYDWAFSPVVGLYVGGRYSMAFDGDYEKESAYSAAYLVVNSNLSLPVMLAFNIPAGQSSFFINVGPTFDYWLANKTIYTAQTSSTSASKVINNFDGNYLNRFNVYLGGKVGFNIKNHVKIYAGYDQSLINYSKQDKVKMSMGLLKIGAAYVF